MHSKKISQIINKNMEDLLYETSEIKKCEELQNEEPNEEPVYTICGLFNLTAEMMDETSCRMINRSATFEEIERIINSPNTTMLSQTSGRIGNLKAKTLNEAIKELLNNNVNYDK